MHTLSPPRHRLMGLVRRSPCVGRLKESCKPSTQVNTSLGAGAACHMGGKSKMAELRCKIRNDQDNDKASPLINIEGPDIMDSVNLISDGDGYLPSFITTWAAETLQGHA